MYTTTIAPLPSDHHMPVLVLRGAGHVEVRALLSEAKRLRAETPESFCRWAGRQSSASPAYIGRRCISPIVEVV